MAKNTSSFNKMKRPLKRQQITREILETLLYLGNLYFLPGTKHFIPALCGFYDLSRRQSKLPSTRHSPKKFKTAFRYLRNKGMIDFQWRGNQIFISLTKEGKKKAGRYQINDLKIKKPLKWDGKWRVVIFDVLSDDKVVREALRGKLKELKFHQLQKSVWVHPFDCLSEIKLLGDFFGLNDHRLRLITAEDVGNDKKLRKFYNLM